MKNPTAIVKKPCFGVAETPVNGDAKRAENLAPMNSVATVCPWRTDFFLLVPDTFDATNTWQTQLEGGRRC